MLPSATLRQRVSNAAFGYAQAAGVERWLSGVETTETALTSDNHLVIFAKADFSHPTPMNGYRGP